MAVYKSEQASGLKPVPVPAGMETITREVSVVLPGGSAKLAVGDVVQLGILPPNCLLLAMDFDTGGGDPDSGTATLAADLGLLTAAGDAVSSAAADGAKFITAGTQLQAPIAVDSPTAVVRSKCRAVAPAGIARVIAFVVTTAANAQASAVTVSARITYCAA